VRRLHRQAARHARNDIYGALIEKALAGGLITQEDLQRAKAEYDAAA
jgi:hypothetical protein